MPFFFRRLAPFAAIFLIIQTLVRVSLMIRANVGELEMTITDIAQMITRGAWLDVVTASFVLIPIALVAWLTPATFWGTRAGRIAENLLRFVFVYVMLFDAVAEHLFWSEFTTRFNFIAVDYLVYTTEVISNIVESYPLTPLLLGIGAIAIGIVAAMFKINPQGLDGFKLRSIAMGVFVLATLGLYTASSTTQANIGDNAEQSEIAANGIYNLFYAYWHNEISYNRFYAQNETHEVKADARDLLFEHEDAFEENGSLVRLITPKGPEKHKNVILVVMESMSADFMGSFGNKSNLTPNLDALAKQGLSFADAYATGTRTVRGLEAVTLSVPPTPGQSIVRRPGNDNLYSLGFVFKDRGYDTAFIYGGYGYFDNMNAFFEGNGFDIIDRTKFDKSEYSFANAWGLADDDVFAKSLKEADKSYAAHKPFMHLIMTTSNHRPYTFPEGRIANEQGHRESGVRYADYSVGKLVEWAQTKPWFKDTVFIFVADHTAGAGGKVELSQKKYHIPMIFYAPGFIKRHTYNKIASQIDMAPILLGQLNFSYRSKFYGEDLMHDDDEVPHAFISNYQKIALVKSDTITILSPKHGVTQLTWPDQKPMPVPSEKLRNDTIGYYQSASWWRETLRRVPTVIEKR